MPYLKDFEVLVETLQAQPQQRPARRKKESTNKSLQPLLQFHNHNFSSHAAHFYTNILCQRLKDSTL